MELYFDGLPFDPDTDYIVELSLDADWVEILSITEEGPVYSQYEIQDDKSVELMGTYPIVSFGSEYDNSDIKQIISLPCDNEIGGYQHYCLTNSNELYWIVPDEFDVNKDGYAEATLTNKLEVVDNVYASGGQLWTLCPMYSKLVDQEKLYVTRQSYNNGAYETYEIAYVMPDGHTVDEVVNVFGNIGTNKYSSLIVEFSNGDIYYNIVEMGGS